MRRSVKSLLAERAGQLHALAPEQTVADAVALMNRANVGAILVLDPEQTLQGIFTERDVLRRVLENRVDVDTMPIESVMTREVYCVEPNCTIDEAMALVSERNVRHLPVLEGTRVMGMVSVRDLTAAMVEVRNVELAELNSYVRGSYGGYGGE